MIQEIDFDGAEFGDYGLNGDGENQVDDLKGRPEDLTLDSEMEQFTNSELDFLFVILS